MNLKDKSVCVYDNSGFFTSFASLLTKWFGKVGYFYPWEHFYSDGRELVVGQGLPGVDRVKYLEREIDSFELLVFTSAQDGHYQNWLRKLGYRVFGSALGSDVELMRWKTKGLFQEAGIQLAPAHRLSGIEELRKFFRDNPSDENWYVKISELRGMGDTWGAKNYAEAKGQIDEWEARYSPQCYLMHYIVESAIPDADEIGYDGLNIDGQFPDKCMWGAEIKDCCYFGKVSDYSDIPEPVRQVNDALVPVLRQNQYRNTFSTELRNKSPIDITARFSSPAGEVILQNIANLGEVVWFGAEGTLVQPEWIHTHGCQTVITSDWAWEHRVILDFSEEIRPFLKLYNHARVDAGDGIGVKDQFVPQVMKMRQLGSVVALADDPVEAKRLCRERAEQVAGFDVQCDCDPLDKAASQILESEDAGVETSST